MRKALRKMMALALAMVMVLGTFSMTALAAAENKEIKVNGLEAGDNVKYYKVVEWKSDGSGWAFVAPFAGLLDENQQKQILGYVETNAQTGEKTTVDGKITDETAAIMGGANATALNGDGDTVADGETSWSATNVDPGLYMALITGAAPDAEDGETMHVYNPVFLAVQSDNTGTELTLPLNYADEGTAKKTDITVDKKAKSAGGDWTDATSENVGDIIDFKVETTVPAYLESWTNPVFTVTDTMSSGLTLAVKEGEGDAALTDITVSGATTGDMTEGTQYTVTKSATGYTITFKDAYLKGRTAAEVVTITYKAKITAEAKNVNPETNTVTIEYSKNPKDSSDHGTKEDKTTHYTFSIDAGLFGDENYETSELVKVGVDAAGNPIEEVKTDYHNGTQHAALQGAEFKLYKNQACTEPYTNSTITADTVFTTDDHGKLNITGLDEGTYYLKETKAATGYQLLTDIVSYTITATYKDVAATETCNAYKVLSGYTVSVNGGATSTYEFDNGAIVKKENKAGDNSTEIKNTKGQSLPATGGIGTTLFYLIGTILVLGAGILLVTRRRMRAR